MSLEYQGAPLRMEKKNAFKARKEAEKAARKREVGQ